MKQHFESKYLAFDKPEFSIMPITDHGREIAEYGKGYTISVISDEITQGCINRIVDNLNKLAEHIANNEAKHDK